MKTRFYSEDFQRGLQTTHGVEGLRLGDFTVFQNVRVNRQTARRRAGVRGVTELPEVSQGASDFIAASADPLVVGAAPSHSHGFGRRWTFKAICKPTFLAVEEVYGWPGMANGPLEVEANAAGKIVVRVEDESAVVTTMTSATTFVNGAVLGIQVSRQEGGLTLWVNGLVEATATMSLEPGIDPTVAMNIGSTFNGIIDSVTVLSRSLSAQVDPLLRFPSPRVSYCVADYNMKQNADGVVVDRSRYGNHGKFPGNFTTNVSPLAHLFRPVQAMWSYRNRQGELHVAVIGGGGFYNAGVE